jgi:hypothetical protein
LQLEKISSEALKNWLEGEDFDNSPFFVVVKTPGCIKCEALLKKENIFKKSDWFRTYTFTPQDKIGLEILQQIGVTSAPFIIFRYKLERKNFYKYTGDCIIPDVEDGFINLENTFDAIYDKDFQFFGFNELGEELEKDSNPTMLGLLYEIYGSPDEETLKEREKFKETLTK